MEGDALEKVLGPLEGEVVRAVWSQREPVTVRDVLAHVNSDRAEPLAYTTVMTVMSRLAEKGVLRRKHAGRSYFYEATVRDAAEIAVRDVLRVFGDAAVAHFVEEAGSDPKIMRRLRRLMDDES